ncbi:hypothetical protein QFZ81_003622 [Paenibacillus sp. V4I9]|uniref:hypothetical protein n=1 Tax=unclassified Paenibacillus TaxID=185978 RepID=UPI0027869360|nr:MULTISPECIES: hypothetical protein [unclassified Paenibacillus]MDQ0888534.1 hypothetical protein [Paenibacillus sp. V4I9]MDQ0897492.1 hypothetical protein [Paenibacillus sp. V4I7]
MSKININKITSYFGFLASAITIFLFIIIRIQNGSDLGGLPAILIPMGLLSIISSVTQKAFFMYISLLLSLPLVSLWKPNMGSLGLLAIIPMFILIAALLMTFESVRFRMQRSQ